MSASSGADRRSRRRSVSNGSKSGSTRIGGSVPSSLRHAVHVGDLPTYASQSKTRETGRTRHGAMVVRAEGTFRRARAGEPSIARECPGGPSRAPAVGLHAARIRRLGRALSLGVRDPGPHRPARHVAEPVAVPSQLPGARRRPVRSRGRSSRHRRLGRLLDLARRQPVPRLARDGQLPDVPVRRDRAVRRRAVSHDRRPGPPRDPGKVERRVRRDGGADAPARPLGRPRHARRRRALRGLLSPRVPRVGPRAPRRLRGLLRHLLEGLPEPAGLLEGQRRSPVERLVHGRVLFDRSGRDRPAARSTRPPAS